MKTTLSNIILIKTSFERDNILDVENELKLSTRININHTIVDKKSLVVIFEYILMPETTTEDSAPQFKYSSTHIAQLELEEFDDTAEDFEELIRRFSSINVAAMIFPFIRENAATISAKAGMAPIMIPVQNFVALYEESKK